MHRSISSGSCIPPCQIPLSSPPIYEEIDLLYQLTGRALPPSTSRPPWNTYEALAILDAIEEDTPPIKTYGTQRTRELRGGSHSTR